MIGSIATLCFLFHLNISIENVVNSPVLINVYGNMSRQVDGPLRGLPLTANILGHSFGDYNDSRAATLVFSFTLN